jgi:D-sedoheptulose 7-phosphate isomerase
LKRKILESVKEAELALGQLMAPLAQTFLEKGALALAACFQAGGKVLIAGNGGSLCDAAHFAEELTGFFRKKRKALPAIALSEPGHLTCVGNDMGFEYVFARAIEAYGKPGDLFIGLSTSGNSPNIIRAFEKAKELGLMTMAFLGKNGGGKLKGCADLELVIDGFSTSDRIQEAHMAAIHILIELVEDLLFGHSQEEILTDLIAAVRK